MKKVWKTIIIAAVAAVVLTALILAGVLPVWWAFPADLNGVRNDALGGVASTNGKYVYYHINYDGLYRMDMDGSNTKRISEDKSVYRIIARGDKVYFLSITSNNYALYRMDWDGANRVLLKDFKRNPINSLQLSVNDAFYYKPLYRDEEMPGETGMDDTKIVLGRPLYRMASDGTGAKRILKSIDNYEFAISGNAIYMLGMSSGRYGIYRANPLFGLYRRVYTSRGMEGIAVSQGKLYFIDMGMMHTGSNHLMRVNANGIGKAEDLGITPGYRTGDLNMRAVPYNILGDRIFYSDKAGVHLFIPGGKDMLLYAPEENKVCKLTALTGEWVFFTVYTRKMDGKLEFMVSPEDYMMRSDGSGLNRYFEER